MGLATVEGLLLLAITKFFNFALALVLVIVFFFLALLITPKPEAAKMTLGPRPVTFLPCRKNLAQFQARP